MMVFMGSWFGKFLSIFSLKRVMARKIEEIIEILR